VGELRALKARDLDRAAPALVLAAEHTKNRKRARQFISIDLCDRLVALAAGKPDGAPLLGIPVSKASAAFRRDANAAGIARLTAEGKATWHSLRKVFVNAVVRGGADVRTAMELARHSTAAMTLEVYASADPERVHAAANAAAEHLAETIGGTPVVTPPNGDNRPSGGSLLAPVPSGASEGGGGGGNRTPVP